SSPRKTARKPSLSMRIPQRKQDNTTSTRKHPKKGFRFCLLGTFSGFSCSQNLLGRSRFDLCDISYCTSGVFHAGDDWASLVEVEYLSARVLVKKTLEKRLCKWNIILWSFIPFQTRIFSHRKP